LFATTVVAAEADDATAIHSPITTSPINGNEIV
jgi:hypothetical protein